MPKITVKLDAPRIWRYKYKGDKVEYKGYTFIWCDGLYKAEHRLVVERALGRELKSHEEVHHVDGKKSNNENKNLVVCEKDYHDYLDVCRVLEALKRRRMSLGRLKLKRRLEREKKAFLSGQGKGGS
jgi:hypothetical protein